MSVKKKDWKIFDYLKTKFLKARKICAKEITAKEIWLNGIQIDPRSAGKQINKRGPMEVAETNIVPTQKVTLKNSIPFSSTYLVPAVLQIPPISPNSVNQRFPITTVSVQVEIDNDLEKLEEMRMVGLIGYYSTEGLVLYNPNTRIWSLFSGDLTPFEINSINWKNKNEKVVNLQSYLVFTNDETKDIIDRQNLIVSLEYLIPPELNRVNYIVFIDGQFDAGSFQDLVRTQYSATHYFSPPI